MFNFPNDTGSDDEKQKPIDFIAKVLCAGVARSHTLNENSWLLHIVTFTQNLTLVGANEREEEHHEEERKNPFAASTTTSRVGRFLLHIIDDGVEDVASPLFFFAQAGLPHKTRRDRKSGGGEPARHKKGEEFSPARWI